MDKLTYEALDHLVAGGQINLDITNVDVKRLRDDRSEIQLGQEVAFVATAAFRINGDGLTALKAAAPKGALSNLAAGNELLVIGTDAELRSEHCEIDEDSVALWLHDRYKFKFTLNGKHRDDGRDVFTPMGQVHIKTGSPEQHPHKLALPWLTKLNTAEVKDDYIDVDVRIEESEPDASHKQPPPLSVVEIGELTSQPEDRSTSFQLLVDASAKEATRETFRLTSDTGAELVITIAPSGGNAIKSLSRPVHAGRHSKNP
jgi:hypothetical protein